MRPLFALKNQRSKVSDELIALAHHARNLHFFLNPKKRISTLQIAY
jgi:hypothetical protein